MHRIPAHNTMMSFRRAFGRQLLLILPLAFSALTQGAAGQTSDGVGFLGEISSVSPSQLILKTRGTSGEETKTVSLLPETKYTSGDWSSLRQGTPVFVGIRTDGEAISARVVSDLSGGGAGTVDRNALSRVLSAGIATGLKTGQTVKSIPGTASFSANALYANTTISGSMTTTTGQNVAGLTLQIYGLSDRTIAGTVITNNSGAFSVTGEFVGDYVFRLLDSNGRILSYSPAIFVIPGNNISDVRLPVEPMCKGSSGYQPTSNSIDFIGCLGLPSIAYSTNLNLLLYTDGIVRLSLTHLDFTLSLGGGSFEFPFRFSAVDITSRDLEAWSNKCIAANLPLSSCPNKPFEPSATSPRPVAVSVQPIAPPGPAYTWGGGVSVTLYFSITTAIGCGDLGLSSCSFTPPPLTVAPRSLFAYANTGLGAPVASGRTLNAPASSCIPIGFKQVLEAGGFPSLIAGYLSPLDLHICEPATITAPANGFISQLSGVNGTVTANGVTNPSLGFTGGEYTVYMQADSSVNNTSIRFSNFNYVPTFEDEFQVKLTSSLNSVITESSPLTIQTQQVPFISTPFPPAGSATLQGTQRTFIDIPVAVAASGSITLGDFAPTGVAQAGGTTVTIHGRGFNPAKYASGAPIPGTGVTDVLYTNQSVTISTRGGYTVVSDTELQVQVPVYFTSAPARAELKIQGWGGAQSIFLNVVPTPVVNVRGTAAFNAPAGTAQPIIPVGFLHYLFDQSVPAPNSVTGIFVDGVATNFTQCTTASTSQLCAGTFKDTNVWVFQAPRMSPGPHHVTVSAACDQTSGLTNGAYCGTTIGGLGVSPSDTLNYQGQPHLTSLSKTLGVVAGGDRIVLNGTGFLGLVNVKVGSAATSICNSRVLNCTGTPSDTSLTVTVPPGAAGVGVPVQVSITACPGYDSSCGDSETLIYSYFGPPGIGSLSPASGAHSGGTVVTVNGTGFSSATAVSLGSNPVAFTVVDDQHLTFTTPAGYPNLIQTLPGSLNVTVTTSCTAAFPNATSCGASNTSAFTYNAPANLAATTLTVAAVTGPAGGTTQMSATLKAGSTPLAGKAISFTAKGNSAGSAVTNASGVATLNAGSLAGVASGIYPTGAAAAWGGDLVYAASTSTSQITAKTSAIVTFGNAPAIPPVDHIVSVAAGDRRLIALTDTGLVTGWGATPWTPDSGVLVPGGLSGISAISTSKQIRDVTAALRGDGSVAVWNDLGVAQCSGCNLKTVSASTRALILTGVDSTGKVVAWGYPPHDTNHILTVPAAALSGAKSVATGYKHAIALKSDGTVVTWGCGTCGIEPPAGLTGVVAVAAGEDGNSLALKQDGTLAKWGGYDGSGLPGFVAGKRFIAIDFDGRNAPYALADDGTLYSLLVGYPGGTVVGSAGPAPLGFSAGADWFAIRVPQRLAVTGTVGTVSGKVGDPKTISATFMSGDVPVSGVQVAFALNGITIGTSATNAAGVATVAAVIPALAGGNYPAGLTATVPTDATWQGSTASGSLTVVTVPQSISFPGVANRTYGDVSFDLGATASSALPLTYTVNSGPVSVNGSIATITGVGSVSITASQPGSGLYDPAVSVTQIFSVGKATLTVTPGAVTKVYGTDVPTLTGTLAGLRYTDAAVMIGQSDGSSANAAAGSWDIVASGVSFSSGSSANYLIQLNTLSAGLTVTKARLTVTANSITKAYGQAATLGFTTAGLVNSDTVASVTLTSAGAAATATVVGSPWTIMPSAVTGTGLGNYTITCVPGSLTITPAALTITARPAAKVWSTETFFAGTEFTITGSLLNGDTVSSVDLESWGAGLVAPVGTYPIHLGPATGNGVGNYAINYVEGVLTVNRLPVTITPKRQTKTYGDSVSDLSQRRALNQVDITSPTGTFVFPIQNPPADYMALAVPGLPLGSVTITGLTLTNPGLDAAATVAGSPYAITPDAVTGNGLENVSFIYAKGTLGVRPAAATVTLVNAAPTYTGKPIPAAVTTVPADLALHFVYPGSNPAIAPVDAGSYGITVVIDNKNYAVNSAYEFALGMVVQKATPVIAWTKPAAIVFGSTLSSGQLNARSNVPGGTMTYSPAAGTVMPVGNGQILTVTMADSPNTYPASASTVIDVIQSTATPAQLVLTPSFMRYTSLDDPSGILQLLFTIANKGGTTANQVKFTSVKIGTVAVDLSGNNFPRNIAPGDTGIFDFNPPYNVAAPKSTVVVTWSGSYAGSTFSGSARVTLPQ